MLLRVGNFTPYYSVARASEGAQRIPRAAGPRPRFCGRSRARGASGEPHPGRGSCTGEPDESRRRGAPLAWRHRFFFFVAAHERAARPASRNLNEGAHRGGPDESQRREAPLAWRHRFFFGDRRVGESCRQFISLVESSPHLPARSGTKVPATQVQACGTAYRARS